MKGIKLICMYDCEAVGYSVKLHLHCVTESVVLLVDVVMRNSFVQNVSVKVNPTWSRLSLVGKACQSANDGPVFAAFGGGKMAHSDFRTMRWQPSSCVPNRGVISSISNN